MASKLSEKDVQRNKELDKRRYKELDKRSKELEREKSKILEKEGYKERSHAILWLIIFAALIGILAYYFIYMKK